MNEVQVIENGGVQTVPLNVIGEVLARSAAAKVQARIVQAMQRPRDIMACYSGAMKEIERQSLAKVALYSFPRGGQTITGPSIKVITMIARHFKNIDFDWAEIQRADGYSVCQSWCIDLEANNAHTRTFTVNHTRDTRGGTKKLTDERDIAEKIANISTRNMRACMEKMIPEDIVDDVLEKAKAVIAKGDGKPWEDRLRNMLLAFESLQVTQEMLEKRLKHAWGQVNQDEFAELYGIYNSLKDKLHKREEFFDVISEDATTVAQVNENHAKAASEAQKTDLLERIEKKISEMMQGGVQESQIETALGLMSLQDINVLNYQQLQGVWEVLSTYEPETPAPEPAAPDTEEQHRLDMLGKFKELVRSKKMTNAVLLEKTGMTASMIERATLSDLTKFYMVLQ